VDNALTIDFEDWYHGIELPREDWRLHEDRLASVTPRLLALLAEVEARATFFVLGDVAERQPELVEEIHSAGHEIATHGWSHEFVYRLDADTFARELRRSVDTLGEIIGAPIRGHRAPYFSITKDSLWALDILSEHGIAYDSSIFPVRNYRYGIEDAPRWPYKVSTRQGELTEFPMTTVELLGRRVPISGGAYFRIYPYAVTRRAFRSLNAKGRFVVFYLHPWELDPGHPRIDVPRRVAATHHANLRRTEPRFRRLLRDFDFKPMGDMIDAD
jgi:polysaccharide deacetylase family protein (PEP-CTERM system associated)